MSVDSSESSSGFSGWAVNDARVDQEDQECTTTDYNYYKQFTLILQEDGSEQIIKKFDSVMVSGDEKLPFVGLIEKIYVKKTNDADDVEESSTSSEEDCNDDVRVVISWYYRQQDISMHDRRVHAPELEDCELLYSAHVNKIKAKYVMYPCEVFFVRNCEDIPTKFDITNSGKLSQKKMPGQFVRKGCHVNNQGQITKFFAIDEAKTASVKQKLDQMMDKTKGQLRDLVQQEITQNFLKTIANQTQQKIAALTDYWDTLTQPGCQFQSHVLIDKVKQVVPEFQIEHIQELMISISVQNILYTYSQEIVVKLLVLLCILALRLIMDIKSAPHPIPQQLDVLSQILISIRDCLTPEKQLVEKVLYRWMMASSWHDTVQLQFSQNGQKFQKNDLILPFDGILKKLKLNKRKTEKKVVEQQQTTTTKKVQESKRSPVQAESKQEKVQKKTKVQQKTPKSAGGKSGGGGKKKGKAVNYVLHSSTDDEMGSAPQTEVTSTSIQDRDFAATIPESNVPTASAVHLEQLSFTGGKFKYPKQPPNFDFLTMDQITNLHTKVDMEEQKSKVGKQLKETRQLCTKVSWLEDQKQEEGLYVMAHVPKQQDYFLEFVFVFDRHDCPEFLASSRFVEMWPSQNWRKCLKQESGQFSDVSEWLRSLGWMDV